MKNVFWKILKTIGNVAAAILILILAQLVSGIIGGMLPDPCIGDIISAVLYIAAALGLGILYAKYVLHLTPAQLGVKRKAPELKWVLTGILLPVLVSVFYLVFMDGELIKNDRLTRVYPTVIFAVFTTGRGGGIVEELVFRGLIMRTMEKYWGKTIAILVPSFLFGAVHLANMSSWHLLDAVLLLLAGTMVGVMFSLIAYQSGTVWSSAVVHGIWNVVIIGGILEIGAANYDMRIDSIWQYKLASSNFLITGGAFGIEAALPALIGYALVSIVAIGGERCSTDQLARTE